MPVWLLHTVFHFHHVFELPRRKMTPWVHRDDLFLVTPLGERAYFRGGLGVGEVRPCLMLESRGILPAGHTCGQY